MYHISDLKKFKRCPCYYFKTLNNDDTFLPYLRNDNSIIDLIIQKFDLENYFLGKTNDSIDEFFNNQEKYEWFIKPRFVEKDLRINIPLMHKVETGYDIFFFYSGVSLKDIDVFSYRINLNLLERVGVIVNKVYIIYLNQKYVFHEKLDAKELLVVTDKFHDKEIIDILNNDIVDYNEIIKQIESTNESDYVPKKNRYCLQFGECEFYKDCFKEIKDVDDDSIMHLVSCADKLKMFESGITKLQDINVDDININRVQYAQIMASRNGGLYMDKTAVKCFLEKINVRPIAFVDFEWDRYLIPEYEMMKPFDVVCFEYALYVLDENDNLQHYTFVGNKDCRKDFVEGLLKYLPKDGPILAYNAEGAEVLRLKELSEIYPEYKEELESVINRFIDLAWPFCEGLIYDLRMRGNFTLKKLVDICSDYSYKNLDINDGMKAVYQWRDIDKENVENKEEIIENLKEYCSLDAYGLYLVYKWLNSLAKED